MSKIINKTKSILGNISKNLFGNHHPFIYKLRALDDTICNLPAIFRKAVSRSKKVPHDSILKEPVGRYQARQSDKKMQCIIFDEKVPTPDQDSGSVRMFHILKILAKRGRCAFVPLSPSKSPEYETLLKKEGIEIIYPKDYLNRMKSEEFNVAIMSRPSVANRVFKKIREVNKHIKIIFDTVDIHFLRFEREFKLTGNRNIEKEALYFKEVEKRLASLSDLVWCVSPVDKEVLQNEAPEADIQIVPNIHALKSRGKRFEERKGLLFIGCFLHSPNVDAIHYFLAKIYPIIRQEIKDIQFYVVGSEVPEEISAYSSKDVIITGHVPDVDPYFQSCRLSVAPLQFGAGMKGKVGQALAYGLPVVTTSIGAEGMNLKHGYEAMIVDDHERFAKAVISVYQNKDLWQRLSDYGYQHIQKHFSPETLEINIMEMINTLLNSKT